MKSINEIRKELLKVCRENGGIITDVEIILILPKDKDLINEEEFIKRFNQIKKERGRNSLIRGLSTQAKNNLKKLIKRGYTWYELECAIKGMYQTGWAEKNDNDIPNHLLREDVFDRYLTAYLNGEEQDKNGFEEQKRAEEIKRLKKKEKEEAEKKEKEEAELSMNLLTKESLTRFYNLVELGVEKWTGTKYEAKLISGIVSKDLVTLEEKKKIYLNVLDNEEQRALSVINLNKFKKEEVKNRFNKMREGFENSTFEINSICSEEVVNLSLKRLKK